MGADGRLPTAGPPARPRQNPPTPVRPIPPDPALADPALSKFFVPESLARFRRVGGVRLEDVVVVTSDIDNNPCFRVTVLDIAGFR